MTIAGASEYISPELKNNKIKYDKGLFNEITGVDLVKNDIFSLGLTFLEALTLESVENCNISTEILSEKLKYLD